MSELSISNVINISLAATPTGINAFNLSNLAIFSDEVPEISFGDGEYKIYKDPTEVAVDFGSGSVTAALATAVFSQAPNILANGGNLIVIPLEASETLLEALQRTTNVVHYFGILSTAIEIGQSVEEVGAWVQTQNKVFFCAQKDSAVVEPTGLFDDVRAAGLWRTRCLFYGSSADLDCLKYAAAYAGRALSVVFSGSNTTITMHLKELAGVLPDPSMTETLFAKCKAAGADIYASIRSASVVLTSGANRFFDRVQNISWFIGDLEVRGFNYFRQTPTKQPQTEKAMDGLKGEYRKSCEQGVRNAFLAPGKWTLPFTFGDQEAMLQNISQLGYYIYSLPITEQAQSEREERKSPLVQIGIKEAGALHESNVLINVNA